MDKRQLRPFDGVIPDPPWVVAPGLPTVHGARRQGDLEGYFRDWKLCVESQPREKALDYLRSVNPPEEGFWAEDIGKYLKRLEGEDWPAIRARAIGRLLRRDEITCGIRFSKERKPWLARIRRWFGLGRDKGESA